jgi:DNA polymerase IV
MSTDIPKNNERIIQILSRLNTLRRFQENKWEEKSNKRAIKAIESLPDDITDISYFKYNKINGIGSGIIKHIKDILSVPKEKWIIDRVSIDDITGIPELDILKPSVKDKLFIITDLMTITGIGPTKAEKYYYDGYRNAEELAAQLPGSVMVKHFKQLKKRIPREKIDRWSNVLKQIIDYLNKIKGSHLEFVISGSYARGAPNSGDMDVILYSKINNEVAQYFPILLNTLIKYGYIVDTVKEGTDKYQGIAYLDEENSAVQLDIELVNDYKTFPYILSYFTGNYIFNTNLRAAAHRLGYDLTNNRMTDRNGNFVVVKDEHEIFDILGVPYVPPNERNV